LVGEDNLVFPAGRLRWTKIVTNGLPVAPTIYGSKLVSLTAKSVSIGPRLVPNGILDPGEPDLNTYHGTTTSNLYVDD
jgi:hypothetical protein